MITVRKAGERGHASFDWLDTWHTFSFADYPDAQHVGFRALRVSHTLKPGRHGWLQMAEGEVKLNGLPLKAGDGAAVSDESRLIIESAGTAQVILFDLNQIIRTNP
jgi:redox-sensitive bicupin YhaK (pirin superfamily)